MPSSFRYWAFISYSHADKALATALHNFLESYRIPEPLREGTDLPAKLYPVFRDRESLGLSDDLTAEIREGIADSRCFVVVCSPESAASTWVAHETELFIRRHGPARVFCLVARGVPNGGGDRECLPLPLRRDVIGRDILAADASPEADGKRGAFLKMLAAIGELNYEQLARRDQRRMRRRATITAGVSLAVAACLGTMGVVALVKSREAQRQARRAEATSSYLTSMLLQFLPRTTTGIPTASLLPLIDASARPEKLSVLEGQPEALLQVRQLLSRSYAELGQFDKSIALELENIPLAARLHGEGSVEWARSVATLAANYNDTRRPAEAEALLRDVLQRTGQTPRASTMRLEVRNGLANALASQKRFEEADLQYEEAFRESQELVPQDDSLVLLTGGNYINSLCRRGDQEGAFQLAQSLLLKAEKTRGPAHPEASWLRSQLGSILAWRGDIESAAEQFATALRDITPAMGKDHKYTLAIAWFYCRALGEIGRQAEAAAILREYFGDPPSREKLGAAGSTISYEELTSLLEQFPAEEVGGKAEP